jgi:hypothetical protein
MLAALELVDYVVVFDESRAERIVRRVRPDVLVKGEDYRGQIVDGQQFVEAYGGRVALAPLLEGHSTTATVAGLSGANDAVINRPRAQRKRKSPPKSLGSRLAESEQSAKRR